MNVGQLPVMEEQIRYDLQGEGCIWILLLKSRALVSISTHDLTNTGDAAQGGIFPLLEEFPVGHNNCVSRVLFKMAVEQAITMNVVAATCGISREQIDKLRGVCVSQVKRSNGAYSFEDAYDFQKRR